MALTATGGNGSTGRVGVSVVVPAYNAAATLPRALESILAQTHLPAEVIIVDDASTDATADIATRWCESHPQAAGRLIRLPVNRGAGSARNAGWAAAREDYIAFLDADDAWHPRKLEIQHGWLSRHPEVALCGHRCVVIGEPEPGFDLAEGAEPPVTLHGLGRFLIANRMSTPSVMLRRDVRPRFVEGKRHSEDYLLWMEIIHAHGPAAVIELPLARLFKARYGETGLSADHRGMRQGEIDTFARLRRQGVISPLTWLIVSALGWLKFLRRAVVRGVIGVR